MTAPNDPAYPMEWYNKTGLTKREAFAMAAMQGMLADPKQNGKWDEYAARAVRCADALLAELAKGEG